MSSTIGKIYNRIYNTICGFENTVNIFHYQYLSTYKLHKDLKQRLEQISAKNILDIGCGSKPYKKFFKSIEFYIGVDLYQSGVVDVVLDDPNILPFENEIFDFVLSTQVFEHVKNLDLLTEVNRVMRKDSKFLITVPFLYHIHDTHDYRRFTELGLFNILNNYGFKNIKIIKEGGVGSTIAIAILSFLDSIMNKNKFTRILKAILLPLWIVLCFCINIVGLCLDKIDSTGLYYNNLLAVCEKS